MTPTLVVIAKAPVPGQVKTRLCPPLTPESSARVAAAALDDTLRVVAAVPGVRRVLALAGAPDLVAHESFELVAQRGEGLAERLAHAFLDAQPGDDGGPTVLVGMDTPQLSPEHLDDALTQLRTHDAVIGRAADGGWWLLGLNQPHLADVLRVVPMSSDETYARTRAALADKGLTVADLPVLRDVDTIADAVEVADLIPGSTFAAALAAALEGVVGR